MKTLIKRLRNALYLVLVCVLCMGCKQKARTYIQPTIQVMPSGYVHISLKICTVMTNPIITIDTTKPHGAIGYYENTIGSDQFMRRLKRDSILRDVNAR